MRVNIEREIVNIERVREADIIEREPDIIERERGRYFFDTFRKSVSCSSSGDNESKIRCTNIKRNRASEVGDTVPPVR